MPAIVPNSDVMGLKTFFGGGGAGVRYVVLLMSIDTGEVLAVMDACYLTAARTAATSAIGSSRRSNSRTSAAAPLWSLTS